MEISPIINILYCHIMIFFNGSLLNYSLYTVSPIDISVWDLLKPLYYYVNGY